MLVFVKYANFGSCPSMTVRTSTSASSSQSRLTALLVLSLSPKYLPLFRISGLTTALCNSPPFPEASACHTTIHCISSNSSVMSSLLAWFLFQDSCVLQDLRKIFEMMNRFQVVPLTFYVLSVWTIIILSEFEVHECVFLAAYPLSPTALIHVSKSSVMFVSSHSRYRLQT